MFEIRIAVPESASAPSLVARFARVFEGGSVSFDQQLREVRVLAEDEANRAAVVTLSALNAWLSENLLPYATIRLGGRSYALARSPLGLVTGGARPLAAQLIALSSALASNGSERARQGAQLLEADRTPVPAARTRSSSIASTAGAALLPPVEPLVKVKRCGGREMESGGAC
jgi:hypothetical protein